MGFKDGRFAKPASCLAPSRHLYLSGIGDKLRTSKDALIAFFSSFGELESVDGDGGVYMPLDKRFVFVTYVELNDALKVHEILSMDATIPNVNSHNLLVRYAALATSKVTEPECTSSTDHVLVPGAAVIPNFLSVAEEADLLSFYCAQEWRESLNRRVQHYGYIFNYRTLMADYVRPCPALPDHVGPLAERIYSAYEARVTTDGALGPGEVVQVDRDSIRINQLTVNEYEPGQGIAPHVDTEACFGPALLVVNLGADIVMTLTKFAPQASVHHGVPVVLERKYLHLPRRCLVVLSGPARYEYAHSIPPRKCDKVDGTVVQRETRVSLTFRHVVVPTIVPSTAPTAPTEDEPQAQTVTQAQSAQDARQLESEYVHDVYDTIAAHWHHTRGKRKVHWQRVKAFLMALPPGSLLADVGCGDGKYFGLNPLVQVVGCDRSLPLLQVSKVADDGTVDHQHEAFCCDALALPLLSDAFDATICIAVLHHISNPDRRVQVLTELARITREGGHIFLQAWAQEQEEGSRHHFATQDVFVPWKLNRRFALTEEAKTAGDQDDLIVYNRYCHVYKEGELEDLVSCVPNLIIEESGFDKGNWFLHLVKRRDDRLGAPLPGAYMLPQKQIRKFGI